MVGRLRTNLMLLTNANPVRQSPAWRIYRVYTAWVSTMRTRILKNTEALQALRAKRGKFFFVVGNLSRLELIALEMLAEVLSYVNSTIRFWSHWPTPTFRERNDVMQSIQADTATSLSARRHRVIAGMGLSGVLISHAIKDLLKWRHSATFCLVALLLSIQYHSWLPSLPQLRSLSQEQMAISPLMSSRST